NHPAELHLRRTVCDLYQGKEKPWDCYLPPNQPKPKVEIHYEPLNKKSQEFMSEQLNYLITHIEDIVDLEIIPFGRTKAAGEDYECKNKDENCYATKIHVRFNYYSL